MNGNTYLSNPRTHVRKRSGVDIQINDISVQDDEPLLEEPDDDAKDISVPARTRRISATLIALWAASLVVVCLVTYFLSVTVSASSLRAFAKGHMTELRSAKSSIVVQKQQFTGSLDFKNRHGFVPPGDPSLEYMGPSPEVDAAWHELTQGRYFLLSDDEAEAAYGDETSKYWNELEGGYMTGLDVLHSLHCLDQLRRSLYPKVYPMDPQHGQMHMAHCVDHLRQLVMCHVDLTPIPTQWFPGISQPYINSSREHTCRDFWMVRDWVTERFNGTTAVQPQHRNEEAVHLKLT